MLSKAQSEIWDSYTLGNKETEARQFNKNKQFSHS